MSQKELNPAITRANERTPIRRHETGLQGWTPWDELGDMHRQMDDFFSRAFGYTPLSRILSNEGMEFVPEVDIYEKGDQVIVECALPGYTPNDVRVNATPEGIRIEGERKGTVNDDSVRHHLRSRSNSYNKFEVSYSLPVEIDPNKVQAKFEHGILRLELPKSEQARQKSVRVNVKGG